ncbi:hypothetical protein Tco_1329946 [Tanacetum coccineum]
MHQPWRTLESIINKCLSRKITSNDRLHQSRVAIIWGMFYKKNVDFAELIWEDFSYQIDNKQLKKGRRENMPYPRFTILIINQFLSLHKTILKGLTFSLNTIKNDGVLIRMKFVRIGEDVQESGKAILDTMMTNKIKQSEAYKAFINYSRCLVPPKKTRGKGSKGKQQEVNTKKKTVITNDDKIITNDPDVAFELGKSISKTDVEIADETRRVHETHARLVTEKATSEEASEESGDEIPWVSTSDEEEKGDDDDDRSIDIEETDDERKNYDNGDQAITDVEKNVAKKTKVEHGDEKQAEEDQDDDDQDQKDQTDNDIIGILITMPQKEKPKLPRSSSIRSLSLNYGNQFLNLSSASSFVGTIKETTKAEIDSLLDVQIQQEILFDLLAPLLDVLVSVIPPQTTTTSTPLTTTLNTPLPTPPIINEDPSTGSYQGKKKRKNGKKSKSSRKSSASKESSKGKTLPKSSKTAKYVHAEETVEEPTHEVIPNKDSFKQPLRPPTPDPEWNTVQTISDEPEQTWFTDLTRAKKPPLTFDELMATPINFSNFAMNRLKIDNLTQEVLLGPVYNLLKGTCQSSIELEYNMEECYKALTVKLNWEYPEGDRCLFDLRKPLPLKDRSCHLTVAAEYFFNNDLEYLKSGSEERYNKDDAFGIAHWGYERKLWYRSQINKFSPHDVYSTLRILSVVSVQVEKLHGHRYLKGIVVQHKLFNLEGSDIVILAVALRMFTKRIIIQKRVEDAQLGVESNQKKLNLTKPREDFPNISTKEPYTPSFDPLGVVYEDSSNRKRLMVLNFIMGYNKGVTRRKWSSTDQRRLKIIVNMINELLWERRIMRNLERMVGARELEMDYKLMQRTTKTELRLEQTQQDISNEVLVNTSAIRNTKMLSGSEDNHHGPSDVVHNPPQPLKDIVDNAAQVSNATTIALGMYKLDPVTLAPKDKNNRETHIYYLKHSMEQAAILREIVEQAKSLNPLDSASYSACKYVKLIQELLGYVRDTCPDIHKPGEKLVAVTPINKKKIVRFAEPIISSM